MQSDPTVREDMQYLLGIRRNSSLVLHLSQKKLAEFQTGGLTEKSKC